MKTRSVCLCAIVLTWAAPALAVPADVLVIVDTSNSMSEPLEAGGPSRLEVAKDIVNQLLPKLGEHRVGLLRFAQLETMAKGGEGPYPVHVEDPDQCTRYADLLVPPAPGGASAAGQWVNGIDAPDDPELRALGDSPLVGTLRTAFRFIRERRMHDPLRNCVNAFLIVITDGADTCASGEELGALDALAEQGRNEDVRALVVSFDAASELAATLAAIGQEPGAAPFDPADIGPLLEIAGAITGKPAPAACLASGVDPQSLGIVWEEPAPPRELPPTRVVTSTRVEDTEGGCAATPAQGAGPPTGLALVCVLLASLLLRRRGVALGALALAVLLHSGCGDTSQEVFTTVDVITPDVLPADDAGPPGIASHSVVDPAAALTAIDKRLGTLLAGYAQVRAEHLAHLLEPEAAYAAVEGDPVAGCLALARSLPLGAYRASMRGPRGCLRARRCNQVDKARVLHDCLAAHGVEADITRCYTDVATRDALAAELRKAATSDLSAAGDALAAILAAAWSDAPETPARLDEISAAVHQAVTDDLDQSVADDVARIRDAFELDADAIGEALQAWENARLERHVFVRLTESGELLDPTLDAPSECTGTYDPEEGLWEIEVKVSAVWARRTEVGAHVQLSYKTVELLEARFRPDLHAGTTVSLVLADASDPATIPQGLPAASTTGCLRPLLQVAGEEVVVGEPFWIAPDDAAACPGEPVVEPLERVHLARIDVELTPRLNGYQQSRYQRTLIDRYGYANTETEAAANGPQWSASLGRKMLAMRVDWPVLHGLPSEADLLDSWLAWLHRSQDLLRAQAAESLGAPWDPPPAGPPVPIVHTVLGHLTQRVGALLPEGAHLATVEPWLIGLVTRRGFVPQGDSVALATQSIVDVWANPLLVIGGDPEARLEAQYAVGALLTEAERIAAVAWSGSTRVLNAGTMLRADLAEWAPWGSDGHTPNEFSGAVERAASAVTGSEFLLVTPGPVELYGTEHVAWWRVDPNSGRGLGEIRVEGTFYGGAIMLGDIQQAVIQLIADSDRCLWVAAICGINGGSMDTGKCLDKAFENFFKGMASNYAKSAGAKLGAAWGSGLGWAGSFDHLDKIGDLLLSGADIFGGLYKAVDQKVECKAQ